MRYLKRQKVKTKKIDFILNNLSREDRDEFLKEILIAEAESRSISDIILGWEATAEINAIPGMKKSILLQTKIVKEYLSNQKHV